MLVTSLHSTLAKGVTSRAKRYLIQSGFAARAARITASIQWAGLGLGMKIGAEFAENIPA